MSAFQPLDLMLGPWLMGKSDIDMLILQCINLRPEYWYYASLLLWIPDNKLLDTGSGSAVV